MNPNSARQLWSKRQTINSAERGTGTACSNRLLPVLGLALAGVLITTGCRTVHSHVNGPLQQTNVAPDCRGSLEIQQPRGEEDVLIILCLSGGGSRASWFSAATMLRLEKVVDEINLLHEVDVISSASCGSLPAAYYCVSRDPGPYSVVRVEQLPPSLPDGLGRSVKIDRRRGLLGISGPMSVRQRDELAALFPSSHDKRAVERLFWVSNHTRAPALWQADDVRDLMTLNYVELLLGASLSPANLAEHWRYWTTAYDRSDQMAKIFQEHLFGAKHVQVSEPVRSVPNAELLGFLDQLPVSAPAGNTAAEAGDDALRWPPMPAVETSVRLELGCGDTPVAETSGLSPIDSAEKKKPRKLAPELSFVPYRFKDLNPERPYLVLNAASGSEAEPNGLGFGDIFTFTREDFQRHLNSSIDNYDLGHAVIASAAFPGVFSFVTLRDFRPAGTNGAPRYLHVFDGGHADNLGLDSAKRIILANRERYRHFVVLLVDSHVPPHGASRAKPDVRHYLVEFNFIHSIHTFLDTIRNHSLDEFKSGVLDGVDLGGRLTFWHLTFDDVRDPVLRARVNQVPLNFKIKAKDVEVIERCVADLVRPDAPKLQELLRVLRVPGAQ